MPLVSVVAPTAGRGPWLRQAVQSALAQTYRNLEVLIVDDSPGGLSAETAKFLRSAECAAQVRVIRMGGVGGAAARNAGVRAALGQWVAFLDDDDEWMPDKLEKQMEMALRVCSRFPVLSCRVRVKTPRAEYDFPRHVYRGGESVAEYLFCRRGWARGSGFLQTSTLLAPRELLLRVPFASGLTVHQDWDWLLRVSCVPGVNIEMLDEPLAIYRTEDGRNTVSRSTDWRLSLEWIRSHTDWLKPQALSWFVAVQCVWKAKAARAGKRDWMEILCAFLFEGQPTWRAAIHFAGFALIPAGWRKGIRDKAWKSPRVSQTWSRSDGWKVVSRQRSR